MQWGVGEPRAPSLGELQRLTPLPAKSLYPAWTLPWTIISCPGPLPMSLGGPLNALRGLCYPLASSGPQLRPCPRLLRPSSRGCAVGEFQHWCLQPRFEFQLTHICVVLGKSPNLSSLSSLVCQITKLTSCRTLAPGTQQVDMSVVLEFFSLEQPSLMLPLLHLPSSDFSFP